MSDTTIKASGAISVISNIAPAAVQKMIGLAMQNRMEEANTIYQMLHPFFDIVTVKTKEKTEFGEYIIRARNPLPIKTLMNICGLPAGLARQPIGKMTKNGIRKVLKTVRKVYLQNPFVLEPIESFFDIDLSTRLFEDKNWKELSYD
jgi:4-hydroxy-tetrahydrodipicolinate synthase